MVVACRSSSIFTGRWRPAMYNSLNRPIVKRDCSKQSSHFLTSFDHATDTAWAPTMETSEDNPSKTLRSRRLYTYLLKP